MSDFFLASIHHLPGTHHPHSWLALLPGTGLTLQLSGAGDTLEHSSWLCSTNSRKAFLFALGSPDRCDSEETVPKFWLVACPTCQQTCSQQQEQQAVNVAARPLAALQCNLGGELCGAAQTGDTSAQVLGRRWKRTTTFTYLHYPGIIPDNHLYDLPCLVGQFANRAVTG